MTQVAGTGNYDLKWSAADDQGGSGVKSVTLFVAVDGGNYTIWQRDITDASGAMVYVGLLGHKYQFLALATDNAGNHELPPAGLSTPDDGSGSNLGSTPSVGSTTPPNFGQPPPPVTTPSTNAPFTARADGHTFAAAGWPLPRSSRACWALFQAQPSSPASASRGRQAPIGPMALAEAPDGTILISGGADRNELFRVAKTGGAVSAPLITEPYPIYNLALDAKGQLWATTGGGPLLQLDPATGVVRAQYGDAVELGLAIDPKTGLIYVGSGSGVETFDPTTQTFSQYSRDLNLRVASLAFANDGTLWATTWPDRTQVVRFTVHARAEGHA